MTAHEKAQREWFKAEIGRRLLALGASKGTGENYTLETLAGTLAITPYDDWIACRFDAPARAGQFLTAQPRGRLNPHSGKWNHVYTLAMFKSRQQAGAAVDDFFCELSRVLPAAA